MLTITPRALHVIQRVTANPRLAVTSGIRIALPENDGAAPQAPLEVRIVQRPQADDQVVERNGGRLYLAPDVVHRITGRQLDAVTDEVGRVHFVARTAA
ncbi:hypothetical protein ASC77_25065 [Nocardioides sp. Root1257]|uniref:hypothetical protein n=1 Tax=unclassified Nocardioides TaxID=2615069 RepID=UPI0006F4F23E|nr:MULTISPECIES: hypothetical protein [unclassified Nocardioides]KQW50932.1 hypothetical protein ASC77_25065 [Nocardioides sp. Root1257]KRC53728.1 hypothetical protein ASE24_24855 [Nocardioides sp. Root224]